MKYFYLMFAVLTISNAHADPGPQTIVCSIKYGFDSVGNHDGYTAYYDVGSLSVQNCISKAMELQLASKPLTKIVYTHYTKTTIVDGAVVIPQASEGWSVSATISSFGIRPTQLDYSEFVNP